MKKEKNDGDQMADYFWSFMVFCFAGLFLKMPFFKVWRYFLKKLLKEFSWEKA